MGGTNGGNRGWRPSIESALAFDVAKLKAHGYLVQDSSEVGVWQWSRDGSVTASVQYRMELKQFSGECVLTYTANDKHVNCVVPMETTPLPWGGVRWWFLCPYTGKRARKLYKFNSIDKFCHREAIRPLPTYASQRVSSGMDRLIDQRWRLRRRLGDELTDLLGEPYKPRNMHWRTYDKFVQRDNALAAQEWGLLDRRFFTLMNDF